MSALESLRLADAAAAQYRHRQLSRLDARRFRFLHSRLCSQIYRRGIPYRRSRRLGGDLPDACHAGARRIDLRVGRRPLRATHHADGRRAALFAVRVPDGLFHGAHDVSCAQGALWHRHGRRMGRRRLACYGDGAGGKPRHRFRHPAGGLSLGLSDRLDRVLPALPGHRLARHVFCRRGAKRCWCSTSGAMSRKAQPS